MSRILTEAWEGYNSKVQRFEAEGGLEAFHEGAKGFVFPNGIGGHVQGGKLSKRLPRKPLISSF